MTALAYAVTDAGTMTRRSLLRTVRYPALLSFAIGIPVILLLLFVFVFGGTLGAGLGAGADGYVDYVVPGILLIGVAGVATNTAIAVAMDMTEGIVARFRSMSISRASVLAGHVTSSVAVTLLVTAVVLAVGLLIGFRPTAGPLEWLAATAMFALIGVAIAWFSVALGMAAKTVESASNWPMIFTLLPFLGSGFVPTDSMPGPVRVFAEHQPFTPFIETIRGLLLGVDTGTAWIAALAWAIGIGLVGFAWSRWLYERKSVR